MPFFVDVFSRERFFQIYWMLHLQQTDGERFRGDISKFGRPYEFEMSGIFCTK